MAYRDIFDELTPEERVHMLQHATERVFDAGTAILVEGEPNRSIYVILDGVVEVHRASICLARLGLGSIFGEMAFLTGEPASATVRAHTPTTALQVDHEQIAALIQQRPGFGIRFYRSIAGTLATRLKHTSERVRSD
jgi:CRP-like cAMP-binding protein